MTARWKEPTVTKRSDEKYRITDVIRTNGRDSWRDSVQSYQ